MRAELDKLRTLPLAVLAAVAAPVLGSLVAAALAASAAAADAAVSPAELALRVVPFVVAVLALLGVVPVAHEYAGRQMLTSLAAVPRRGRLVAAKTLATALVLTATSAVTLAAGFTTALVVQRVVEAPVAPDTPDATRLLGAAAYLVVVGLLAHAQALLVRHLVPALVAVLVLVVVVPPVAAQATDLARWLPDRAASTWYDPAPELLDTTAGTVVALVWLALLGAAGSARFVRSDA
ncbi:ABC transporter permease [Cellulosimicrobium cellulans]|uniref:ABC transporter permease n=1 Tax=Cellulosimicrobium cellulans TaxID=1710 RepID=UPI001965B46E|nr:ABC transporter permease [Cellulosimicrobium cellulans]MBN0039795.1 ABC transporter permease [Cellulosimicrobium cellulans]